MHGLGLGVLLFTALAAGAACGRSGLYQPVVGDREQPIEPDAPRAPDLSTPDAPCSTHTGDFLVSDESDAAELGRYCEVIGSITVERAVLARLFLPRLRSVSEKLTIVRNDALLDVQLPALTHVGDSLVLGRFHQYPGVLRTADLPALEQVDGDLRVDNEPALERLELSRLERVGGSLEVTTGWGETRPAVLRALVLRQLRSVGRDLKVADNAALVVLDLRRLAEVGGALTVGYASFGREGEYFPERNPWLEAVRLPALTSVGGAFEVHVGDHLLAIAAPRLEHVERVSLERNPVLEELALPVLRSCELGLRVIANPALARVVLRAVSACGAIEIEDNPKLSTLDLPGLQTAGSLELRNNGSFELALSRLTRVDRNINIRQDAASLQAPSLREVGGGASFSGAIDVELEGLTAIGLWLTASESVRRLGAPRLATIGQSLDIDGTDLPALSLPALESIGSRLHVQANPSFQLLQLEALTSIGRSPPEWDPTRDDLELLDNPRLDTVRLPSLAHIAGDCLISTSSQLDVPSACQ